MSTSSDRRLQKELNEMLKNPISGISVDTGAMKDDDLYKWHIQLSGSKGTFYDGERFTLQFKFSSTYPLDSPQVIFIGDNIPAHPHVYSNGHICLSILTEDWSPALTVEGVCLSIISMLSSAKVKKRPADDKIYVRICSKNPKKTKWDFHDEKA
ncbi:Ubiquitin-conjugating enzyme E2 W [Orchesella cincta]|uniref:N-terminal E2 ubiquitin-conjugating enzyme n=1 Tax=Orchesella cincta TaxID=48709 RepID=A0A1D2ML46_ORCCI|nr:Ubiquitin-conjugating enzyme E2 W [Orchesella cincta]